MRAILAMAVLLGVTQSAGAQDGQQFDLQCIGQTRSQSELGELRVSEYVAHMRLDLTAKRYCIDSCELVGVIQEVTDDVIAIQRTNPDRDPRLPTSTFIIVRRSGDLEMSRFPRRGGVEFISTTAACERAPYSGLPHDRKF